MLTRERTSTKLGWLSLVRAAGRLDLLVLAITAIALTDPEAAAIAVAFGVGLLLLRVRGGLAGAVVLGLLFADVAAFMLPGAVSNLTHGDGFLAVALPSLLSVVSLMGLVAVVASLLRRRSPAGPGEVRYVAGGAACVLLLALAAGVVAQVVHQQEPSRAGQPLVELHEVRFTPDRLAVGPGPVTIDVSNHDLFWHTMTVPDLDIDVRVPVGARRSFVVDAPPGTYRFVCTIPGHTQAGMEGTLHVR